MNLDESRIKAALAAKGKHYQPRTRHLENGKPVYTNRLIFEDSPYLLQHAHNPVDWYPWGEEAFTAAHQQNKPIFLSIGYATCHWCHVMEEESFENTDVAKVLNQYFIAIKVDREQHPDIDQTYMTAVTLITGQGGWPMSSFLTPDGKPFYGGTYYRTEQFLQLLLNIQNTWNSRNPESLVQADQLAEAVQRATATQQQVNTLDSSILKTAVDNILSNYDHPFGGFSPAPKFPNEPLLLLLLQYSARHPDEQLYTALHHTLAAMAQGGIYDQIGGGFHRYAVDEHWLVPHFEKMLYNQAYLARVYTQAFTLTGNPLYARIVHQTLDYVLREMTTPQGLFYSATDADSEGQEGTYFIWQKDEIYRLLNEQDAQFVCELFGIHQHGNFSGKNILYLPESLLNIARQYTDLTQLFDRLDPLLEKLRNHRAQRTPPLTDHKIIVAWNAMFITALIEAGEMFLENKYINAAKRAARQLWQTQRDNTGRLWRIHLQGKPSIPGKQEDYAHFAEALLTLYDISGETLFLKQAQSLCDSMLEQFLDPDSGGLLMGREKLLFAHPKDSYDGALPSGNAVAVRVLSRLGKRCNDSRYSQYALDILQCFSSSIMQQPAAYAYMLAQLDEIHNGEPGCLQYAGGGTVRIKACCEKNHLFIRLDIDKGQYITADSLTLKNAPFLENIRYPNPIPKNVIFQQTPLLVYQGQIQIQTDISRHRQASENLLFLQLQLQVCSQQSCSARETIELSVQQPQNSSGG